MAPRIAYLLKKFPRLSETFVLGEMLAQETLGAELHVFSRRTPDDEPRHAELARLRAPVELLPSSLDPWRELFDTNSGAGELLARVRDVHERFAPLGLPKFASLLAEALWLLRRTRELGIEHVHVHFATDSAVTAMLLHELGGPPFSVTAHAKDIYRTSVSAAQLRALLEHSAFVVTVCDANVEHVRGLVGAEAARKLRRHYNGIDIASFATLRRTPIARRVLSIGRLVEKKGFDVLIDALAAMKARGSDFSAVIAGDGEDRERIAQRVAERGLNECVQLVGAVPLERVRALLCEAEVLCLPCKVGDDGNRDALPTVLLEAQAAGVPCISTPVGGVAEILDHGRAGVRVAENDAAATAQAIERMFADAALRDAIAAAGRARAASMFDAHVQSRTLRRWFDESIAVTEASCASLT